MNSIESRKRSRSIHFNSRNFEYDENNEDQDEVIIHKKMDVLTLNDNYMLTTNNADHDTRRKMLNSDFLPLTDERFTCKKEDNAAKKWVMGVKIDFIQDLKLKLNSPEDQRSTEQYFIKIQTDEIICSALIFSSVGSSIIYNQLSYPSLYTQLNEDVNLQLSATLIIITILNILYSKHFNL